MNSTFVERPATWRSTAGRDREASQSMKPGQEGQAACVECLSMHQPWASLLVYGIKRIEGRNWPTNHRGWLWIASTAQEPSAASIEELEAVYRKVHALEGNTPTFPWHYPKSVLLGCVYIVDCLMAEELQAAPGVPKGVPLEILANYCWLCERPRHLIVPQPIRGQRMIYRLPAATAAQFAPALRAPPQIGEKPFSWSNLWRKQEEQQMLEAEGEAGAD